MKPFTVTLRCFAMLSLLFLLNNKTVTAQSWNTIGNVGTTPGTNFIGTTDAKDFVFKTTNTEKGRVKSNGLWQFGATTNLAKIDSGGNLSFSGTAAYKVAANKYAFQYAGNPNYGLFFNSTNLLYEFRTSSALSVFSIGANTGNGIFKGNLKVGAYTLPATDGTSGQVLKTNGAGVLTWTADNGTAYTAGTGISIVGTVITNTAPDQTVTLTSGSGISVTGSYPNFTVTNTGGGGGANTALSNLTTTSINQNLIPALTQTYNLGSASLYWNNIYANGIIYHNGNKFIQSPGSDLTFVGQNAGNSNTSGTNNTFIGGGAGQANTGGYSNTFVGAGCGSINVGGYANSFLGTGAGASNTSGTDNTEVGYNTGNSNSTGNYNSFFGSGVAVLNTASNNSMFGYLAGNATVTGSYNCFFGRSAGQLNNDGSYNSFYGINSGVLNTSGTANTYIGESSGATNSIGSGNTFVGGSAGRVATGDNNTFIGGTAGRNTTTGVENVFTGYGAGYNNTDGTWNVISGTYAGYNNQSGTYNTFMGKNAGFDNTNGNYNVMIGYSTGTGNNTGSNNVFIGNLARGTAPGGGQLSNAVAIGNSAVVEQSNAIVLGAVGTSVGINITQPLAGALQVNTASGTGTSAIYAQSTVSGGNGGVAICNVGSSAYGIWGISSTGYAGYFTGNVGYTGTIANVSDSKFKENVQPLTDALSKIELLNAKTYTFKSEYAKMNLPKGTQMGFIAQDLEKVFPELVLTGYDKSMDATTPMEYKSVNYIGMIPVLTEAVKELDATQTENTQAQTDAIAELKNENAALKNELAAMKLQMQQFDQSLSQCCTSYQSSQLGTTNSKIETPSLEQNVPNPFSQNTIIKYYLPVSAKSGVIKIYSLDGVELKSFAIAQTGFGQITVTGSSLASGVYAYTLIIDGKATDTKQMILTKN